MDEEIDLHPGDLMSVSQIFANGWAEGANLSTGQTGTFPVNRLHFTPLPGSSSVHGQAVAGSPQDNAAPRSPSQHHHNLYRSQSQSNMSRSLSQQSNLTRSGSQATGHSAPPQTKPPSAPEREGVDLKSLDDLLSDIQRELIDETGGAPADEPKTAAQPDSTPVRPPKAPRSTLSSEDAESNSEISRPASEILAGLASPSIVDRTPMNQRIAVDAIPVTPMFPMSVPPRTGLSFQPDTVDGSATRHSSSSRSEAESSSALSTEKTPAEISDVQEEEPVDASEAAASSTPEPVTAAEPEAPLTLSELDQLLISGKINPVDYLAKKKLIQK
ncbi:uncharacterized protein BJ171DRAFT_561366 [Polychytrium aggregatum]|uniref:uncharacterized protein n=1 Tax=Polychytrium aggregatum TaxID=110093 RepID=UPI0022FEE0B7|nr:uncharacterized protein BJ171DRAFT_561366 [Polychytrium aggregatum]KAI9207986.1 hypothetical protein BJ171DRAFT_561366 [Polychytrium aggregatum]